MITANGTVVSFVSARAAKCVRDLRPSVKSAGTRHRFGPSGNLMFVAAQPDVKRMPEAVAGQSARQPDQFLAPASNREADVFCLQSESGMSVDEPSSSNS